MGVGYWLLNYEDPAQQDDTDTDEQVLEVVQPCMDGKEMNEQELLHI